MRKNLLNSHTLRFCSTSDTHGCRFDVPPCDFFCHCGDWSPLNFQGDFIRMQSWLDEFITYLCNIPCRYVVIIAGNHDLIMESLLGKDIFRNTQYRLGLTRTVFDEVGIPVQECKVHYLNRESVTLDGVTFWGSPVTKQINRYVKRWAFETNNPSYEIPSNADVVLTHQPPSCNGLGNTYWKQSTPSKRLGSDELRDAVYSSAAKLLMCGHIHTGNHKMTSLNNESKTRVCNVSYLDEDYEVAYPVTEVNISL